jgi:Fe-S-cluster-containing hydrogenase component 2
MLLKLKEYLIKKFFTVKRETIDKPEHILIRCTGCEQEACTVLCVHNAVAYIMGDLLIETVKCEGCKRNTALIPACITDCRNSAEKQILDMVSIEEKRKAAAGALSVLRF